MNKRKIPPLLILGVCLVVVSCALMIAHRIRMHTGAAHSSRIALQLEEILPERTAGIPGMYPDSGMPVLQMDGEDYAALLEIPAFGLTLPVADGWDSNLLSRSPARFWGSAYDGTLIIGGADDPRQFGFCDKIQHGAQIVVTDMTGARFTYTVSEVNRAKHAETQWLMDGDSDLTLFCHDLYSMEYIAVRCVFAFQ